MGVGNDLVGDLEHLLAAHVLRRQALFRMTGANSHCWRAEMALQDMYPGTRCLLLPSASIGLTLLLEALGLEPGQEVLITPFGWLSNWACIQRARLVTRFLPLNEQLQLEVEQVAGRVNDRTGAVIVTHLMGRGQQAIEDIAELCRDRGIILLEDVAQSFGISIGGQRAGTFGIAAWCSLNHHKLLSTGDGGFVVAQDARIFDKVSALHDQGCILQSGKRRPAAFLEPGLSLRVSELVAAVLRAQLARYHYLRNRILILHAAIAESCKRALDLETLPPHSGDIPFTVLFRRPEPMRYPSLAESGWHVAQNVPWLAKLFAEASQRDAAVAATGANLAQVSAAGAGFVDPFYAIPLGLRINDLADKAPALARSLRETLASRSQTPAGELLPQEG